MIILREQKNTMKDDFDYIENLHLLSNEIRNIPLNKLKSYIICFMDYHYAFEDFIKADHIIYQNAILEAPDNKINFILKNFDKAIATQFGNPDIDLTDLKLTDDFGYSCKTNFKEKKSSKRHILIEIKPSEPELFKKYWLLNLISDCEKIAWNIRNILHKPQPKFEKSINIFALFDKTQKEENILEKQKDEIFSTSKPREQQLEEYYQKILPKSISNIDNFFFWSEAMENSLKEKSVYLNNENENEKLCNISIKHKKEYSQRFEKKLANTDLSDKKKFLLEYKNCIENLKLNKEIENSNISKFTNTILSRIELLLAKNDFTPTIQLKKKAPKKKIKFQSFTLKDYNKRHENLNDLRDALKKKKLIAQDTLLANFKKVFSGGQIEKPIVWTGKINQLFYFISQLHNKLKYVENLKQEHWEVATQCFVNENGVKYDRQRLRRQKPPANTEVTDTALKTLSSLE